MKRLLVAALAVLVSLSASAVEFLYGGAYLQAVTEDSAYIVWLTDKNCEGWVEVKGKGFKATFVASQNGIKLVKRNHQIPITGLSAGQKYEYKVFAKEPKSGKIISQTLNSKGEKLTFVTRDKNKKEFSFLMVTDIHYNRANKDEQIFQKLLTPERMEGKDFVIFDGDMVTTMSGEKWHFDRLFTAATEMFASNIPYYMVRGNHESRGGIADRYMDYFPSWTGQPYYTFSHGPAFFIVIDSGEDKPDSDIEYYGTAVFDEYRRNEGEWLKKVVESKEFKEAKYRILLTHQPLSNLGWHGGRHAYAMFTPHLENKGIQVAIAGHYHSYSYRKIGMLNQTFPTLIFAPKQYLDIKVTPEKMTINVHKMSGELQHTFSYDPLP